MTHDFETFNLFDESNFDAYDSGSDRYASVLKAGLQQHGLDLSDVLAVTQDIGLWAICKRGVFRGDLRGIFNKRAEISEFIPYSRIHSIRQEPSGPHSGRIVLEDPAGRRIARIDFSGGGANRTVESNAAQRERVYGIVQQASGALA